MNFFGACGRLLGEEIDGTAGGDESKRFAFVFVADGGMKAQTGFVVIDIVAGGDTCSQVGQIRAMAKGFKSIISRRHGVQDTGVDGAEKSQGKIKKQYDDNQNRDDLKDRHAFLVSQLRS